MTTKLWIELIFDVIMLGLFIFAAFDDAKTRIVRPVFQWAALGVAVAHLIFVFIAYGWASALGYILTGVGMFALHIILLLIFKSGIGGADTKMTSILSLFLGLIPALIMISANAVSGMAYAGVVGVVKKKPIKSVPLMVFLTVGLVCAQAYGWIALIQNGTII